MSRIHVHTCVNRDQGCMSMFPCHADLERDGGMPYCSVNPLNDQPCEDCDTSRCSDCGQILNVQHHAEDCPKATQV